MSDAQLQPRPTAAPDLPASSSAKARSILDVTVVLLDRGYVSTAIAPAEVFYSAGLLWDNLQGGEPEPRFRVSIASVDGRSVTSNFSLGLSPALAISDIEHTDIIILSASGLELQERIAHTTPLIAWLREWHERGAYIAGICSGVAFLAEAGLLDGRQATTHWAVANALKQRYPKVRWRPEMFVTEDGRVLCSGGVYAAIDLSLYLVEKFCGHEIALQCAKSLLVSMPRSRQSGYAVLPISRPHCDDRIRAVEEHLQEHFAEDVPIEAMASSAGMGQRNFIRRFKAATGHLPGAYLQMLRIAAAKELLERGARSVQLVSSHVGYEDVAFFRALFKRHTGMTPGEYRARFGQLSFENVKIPSATASTRV